MITLKSGRKIDAAVTDLFINNCGDGNELHTAYDSDPPKGAETPLSAEERHDLAELAISSWRRWARDGTVVPLRTRTCEVCGVTLPDDDVVVAGRCASGHR